MSRFKKWKCLAVTNNVKVVLNGTAHITSLPSWDTVGISKRRLYPHESSDFCLLVKRRPRVQQTILQTFSGSTWTATAVSLAAFAGALRLIGRRNVLLEVLDAFVNGGFVTREGDRRGSFLFLLLSAFGIVILSAFTGTFMGFLTVLGEPRQIQTLAEAASHITRVCGSPSMKLLLEDVDKSDVLWKLFANFKSCDAAEMFNTAIREFPNRPQQPGPAIIVNKYVESIIQNNPLLWDKSADAPFGYKVPECLITPTFVSFFVRMKESLRHRLNALLQAIVEAGIYAKIESDVWMRYRYWRFVRRGPALSPPYAAVPPAHTSAPRPLGLSALVEPAVVLGVGALAAAVAFLVEVALRMRANGCFVSRARLRCCRRTARK